MVTLRKAHNEGEIGKFVAEHEQDPPGDEEAFNRALASMAGTSKATPAASSRGNRDD